jgi:phosphatidyl-myo-inositol dimannoside synthase
MSVGTKGVSKRIKSPSILYLAVGVFDKGGISRYCRYQIRALRELVGEENVCTLSFFAPGTSDFEEPFHVDYHAHGPSRAADAAFAIATVRTARALRPDLIWSSHLHFLPHVLTARALTGRVPIALNVYGRELWGGNQWLHHRTVPLSDLVIPDSHFSADYVTAQYGVVPERVRVVWDCVDLARFTPRPKDVGLMRSFGIPVGEHYRYVMTLGRLEARARYKGYDRLLEALAAMRDQTHLIGLFGGDGDDRERLETRARQLNLSGRVFFLGSIPEAQLPQVYNFCDVFSLVSECGPNRGEGLPLTPLEAAACGKPILVGNEDGSREAVIDGVNGWAFSSQDASSYCARLRELLVNDELRGRMGREARRRIELEFSYDGFRAKTAAALDQALSRRATGKVLGKEVNV